jgi:hypothetical protein
MFLELSSAPLKILLILRLIQQVVKWQRAKYLGVF